MNSTLPFWELLPLDQLSPSQWESLCDGCGLCCLNKLQDEDDDDAPIYLTRVVCRCYDIQKGCCSDYENRTTNVPECVALSPQGVSEFHWLPSTCAYRLVAEKKPLPSWHPLISGTPSSVDPYGVKTLDIILEDETIDLEDYIIDED
jgi:uncharacterized cysteine cluster protein YcgN (CxxCxxCC family)